MTVRRAFLYVLIPVTVLLFTVPGRIDPQLPNGLIQLAYAAPVQQELPTVKFEKNADSVVEPNDDNEVDVTIDVIINKAPETGKNVTVSYATANGSAKENVDYKPASGTLTFPSGSTAAQSVDGYDYWK